MERSAIETVRPVPGPATPLAAPWLRGPILSGSAAALCVLLLGACAAANGGQPGARDHASAAAAEAVSSAPADPDVRFVRHMIVHHAQALEMTELVPSRVEDPRIRTLAERIHLSQEDEIARMERWLLETGAEASDVGDHAGHHPNAEHGHQQPAGPEEAADHAGMPGMLSPRQMAALWSAQGAEFDRLFLELMIQHHEGALVMVEELFASEGAAQDPQVFHLASEVDADQRAEIARMRQLLETIGPGSTGNPAPDPLNG